MKQTNYLGRIFLLMLLFLSCAAFAQSTLSGTVKDANGDAVPFASIIEKGTSNGTTSSLDGDFSINVDNLPATLVFSSIGYTTIEQSFTSDSPQNIVLGESAESLDEVVITGLATSIKRSNSANAVSSVTAEQLVGTTGQSTIDGALYGKVTGVNITSTSGAPGGGVALRLRGVSSLTGNNQPLFIIDGVYLNNSEISSGLRGASGANRGNEENSGNRLADIDPNDIQNIEILKGSSAAAIYGQRGNAGVIIITTKRGKAGKTKISFSQDIGTQNIANPLGLRPWTAQSVEDTFGPEERAKYEAVIASRGSLYDYEDIIYGETGFIQDTRLSAAGGNAKTKFYVGGGYRDEAGIIKNTGFERFTFRGNIDHKISETFKLSSNTNFVRSSSSRSFTGNENEGGLSYGYTLAFTRPWNNLYPDEQGNYPNNPNYPGNPLFVRDNAINEDVNNRIIQGLSLTSKLFQDETNNVKLLINGGIDVLANETYVYVPETHQAQIGGQNGFVAVGKNNDTFLNTQAIGVWDKEMMEGDLNLTTQAGIAYIFQERDRLLSTGADLAAGQTTPGQGVNQSVTQNRGEEQDFGYFAQLEGNYKNQIIGTLGYRLDKSTRNGDPNELFGYPKASVAVNVANFDFWELENINQLKFRAAYGETGNPANYGSTFTSYNASSIGGSPGVSLGGLRGDPNIQPETSRELELGVDVGVMDNRVTLEATYYTKTVEDLILGRALPSSSGFTRELTNLADSENRGLELALRGDVVRGENFTWSTGIQYYFNRSEITRLDVDPFTPDGAGFGLGLGSFYIEEGSPITQLVTNLDTDNDPSTPNVPTRVGNVEPDFQMAWDNNITFLKNFDLSFLMQLKSGGENLNLSTLLTDLGGVTPDLETAAGQARLALPFNGERFVQPAGYLRLREAALYYRFPRQVIDQVFGDLVENVKFGFSGRNLFTVSDYNSYDPEVSVNGGSGLSTGIEVTPFPSSKQVYFHLNVNF
ncbi:SusC/RagA family TonB-linked outer membrane protein [Patiriisocius sp. Uisw_047]|jgi:TonB-linked SusC/RagA family outer membrane protein|uniref:SusC/RagA family TonB-linked outer membrane protein n=1 Tax=Patiriisocius sp. Uisw_047 TaxID=3230969 RepID=UPI0039EA86B2